MDSSQGSSIHGMGRVPKSSSSLSCEMLVSRTVRRLRAKRLSWGESSTTRPFGPRLHRPALGNTGFQPTLQCESARTTRHFPSSRCAAAIQIVWPLESTAEIQPKLQLALLRLSVTLFSSQGG
jgi:hypothetical protein